MPDESITLPGLASDTAELPSGLAVGDRVMSWYDADPVEYGGPGDGPWTTLAFQVGASGLPVRHCDPAKVAPADTPIAAGDARLVVDKRARAEMPYGESGPWRLSLPGERGPSRHRTKREAIATGLRRLAILDWHARRVQAGPVVLPHTRMTVPHTRLTLRKLRAMPTSDGEAYTGELLLDGKPVGAIENTGTGGATTWFPHERQVFGWAQMATFVAACRDEHGEPMLEEFVLAELFEEARTARDVARYVRAGRVPVRTFAAITSGEEVVDAYPDAYYGVPGDWTGRLEQLADAMWHQRPGAHAIQVWTGATWVPLPAPQAFRLRLPITGYVVISSSQRDGGEPLPCEAFIDSAGRLNDDEAIAHVRAELAHLAAHAPCNVLHTWRLVHRTTDGERELLAPQQVRGAGAPLSDDQH